MTGIELEQISDIDKYLFIEKGLRGGISYIAKRYAKANNKYLNDYDPKKPSTFISYFDMNNLYGWSMSEYLTVYSCHVTYAFQSESTLYSCLNVKELLARSRREI